MANDMTIGQLSRATGIPQSTIRFYERSGLIRPAGRSSGNYRLYGREAADRLTFIGAAQAAGFRLPEVKAILDLETGRLTCGQAEKLVSAQLTVLQETMLKLRQLERVLQKIKRACVERHTNAPCLVAEPLALRRWLRL